MEYDGFLILHTFKAFLFCVWFYLCLFCIYRHNDSRLMAVAVKPWLNVLCLLLGPFVIFGVYAVQISRKAYVNKMSFSEVVTDIFRGDIWKHKRASIIDIDSPLEIHLLDSSGRSIQEIYSANKRANVTGVIKLSETIIAEALTDSASDILIDPDKNEYIIRFRIDGKLQKVRNIPKDIGSAVINSIKALSGLDIAERRRPQDGAFTANALNENISFRVASAGVVNGEKLSIRVLNTFSGMMLLDEVGLSPKASEQIRRLLAKPSGLIILCGPTGSGKTTSLYAMLSTINSSDRNIITVEDPVEHPMQGVSQIEINTKAGITFASALRSILRQDPDIIVIGEIRDQETAQIAVQASHTGHLVIGTMHSSDNLTSLLRLVDLGVKPTMLADSLSMVISQRLVRRLCDCKTLAKLPPERELILKQRGINVSGIMKPTGCERCRFSGYSGRIGIFDILIMDEELKGGVFSLENVSLDKFREIVSAKVKPKLHKEAMKLVLKGITSYSEVSDI